MKEVVTRKYHDVEKRRTKIRGGIGQKIGKELVKNRYLYFLLIPVAAYYLIFCYAPMFGLVIAFKQYNIGSGIWNSPWVGLKNFKEFFSGIYFMRTLKNTFVISFADILIGFPFPIIFSLMLNELRCTALKKPFKRLHIFRILFPWLLFAV